MKELLAACLFLLWATSGAATFAGTTPAPTDLPLALTAKTVIATATAGGGLGQQNLKFNLRNTTAKEVTLRIPPGLHFKASDAGAQDLLTMQEILIALKPNSQETILLTGYCMQAKNYSPSANMNYTYMGSVSPDLKLLSDSLALYEPLARGYGQMFVWAITNGYTMRNIGVAENLIRPATNIMQYVAQLTHQAPVKVYKEVAYNKNGSLEVTATSVNIFSKKAILTFHNPTDQLITFKIYTEQGQVYRTLLNNHKVRHGLTEYTFGINELTEPGQSPVFYAKVTTASGKVLAQMKVDEHTEAIAARRTTQDFTFNVELTQSVKGAKLNVYLEDGTLVEEFKKYQYLPVGHYNFQVTLMHLYPPGTNFVLKMLAENGTEVARQAVAKK